MNDYVESKGATFILVDWDWTYPGTRPTPSPFVGMDLNLIDTGDDPPPGWSEWKNQGDAHPNARAHLRVARLIYEELVRLNLITDPNM